MAQPNPSNIPGTCLWCGKKLVYKYTHDIFHGEGWMKSKRNRRKMYEKPGPYGDGYFCSLTCGHRFAVVLASNGRRVVTKGLSSLRQKAEG